MIKRIHARGNPRVKELVKQRDRYLFFEGEKLVRDILNRDILNRGLEIAYLIVAEEKEDELGDLSLPRTGETWLVGDSVMGKLSNLREPPGYMVVLEERTGGVDGIGGIDFGASPVVIGLDGVQDPANAGGIFRCAAAFGIDAVAFCGDSVRVNGPKFLRTAQDAFFQVQHQRFPDVDALIDRAQTAGHRVYLTSSHCFPGPPPVDISHVERPCLVLFGREGSGLDRRLFSRYPRLRIPQGDRIESLNLGVSACIIMYELGK